MLADVRARWGALPRSARWALALYPVGFADGTGDHVLAISRGGIHAYAGFPPVPVQAFLIGLVVLDPMALVLTGLVRRAGVWLAVGIMALDMPINWYWNWPRITSQQPGRWLVTTLGPITIFGLFVLVTAPVLLRVLRPFARAGGRVTPASRI